MTEPFTGPGHGVEVYRINLPCEFLRTGQEVRVTSLATCRFLRVRKAKTLATAI